MKLIYLFLFVQVVTAAWDNTLSNLIQRGIQRTVRLIDGGFVFRFWQSPDVPIYMLVRFFNVTNPDRVLRGEKPILEEVGPYVYKEKREVEVEEFRFDNLTVSYRQRTTFFFQPQYSRGSECDKITTMNVPYAVMVEKGLNLSTMEQFLLREIFVENDERLFVQKSVSELLFEGYHQESVSQLAELSGESLLPNNTFGFFYGKNGTLSDLTEIYTGVNDPSTFAETRSWEGQTELTWWDDEYCNMINGSDGGVFTPWVTRNTTLRIFSPDMCRSLYLVYEKDVRVTAMPSYKFVIPRDVLESAEVNPDNECYCNGEKFGPCLKGGAMRLAPCRNGVPVVISWPHFYNGAEEYVNQSIGLSPNASLHESFVILEPYTGLIRRGSKRFQINVELKPTRSFRDMKRVPNMLFPIMWVEESKLSRFRTRAYFANM